MSSPTPLTGLARPAVPIPKDLALKVAAALAEDIGGGDLTAALIPPERNGRATVITREAAILCGIPYVEECFPHADSPLPFHSPPPDAHPPLSPPLSFTPLPPS